MSSVVPGRTLTSNHDESPHHIAIKPKRTQPRVLRQPDAVACTLAGELLAGQRRKGWADAWLSTAIDMKIQDDTGCAEVQTMYSCTLYRVRTCEIGHLHFKQSMELAFVTPVYCSLSNRA